MEQKQIIVVGGGMAGLAAAYYLSGDKRYHITLLEATERLGGRVFTDYSDEKMSELGGFMTFPWYRHTNGIIKDLKLEQTLYKPATTKELYWDEATNGFTYNGTVPLRKLLRKAVLNDPKISRFLTKKAYYAPDLEALAGESSYDFVGRIAGRDKRLITLAEQLVEGYCYGTLQELPASLYAGMLCQFLLYGGFTKCLLFEEGIQKFVTALTENLTMNGVEIHTGATLTPQHTADIIIHADGPPKTGQYKTPTGTKYYSLSGTLNEKLGAPWMVAYPALGTHSPRLTSIGQFPDSEKQPDSTQFLACLKINDNDARNYTHQEVIDVLRQEMRRCVPDASIENIHAIKYWEYTMPVVTTDYVKAVREMQGKDNTYYAGDYFSAPCIETAVYSGFAVAQQLLKK